MSGTSLIVGNSPAMQAVRRAVQVAARCNSTVLITGETGTGKELVARSIHILSARAREPLVAINCGAFSESLLDTELFGHVKGAFTGATADCPGLIRAAHLGTLFLDEFGEMTPATQVRLLRVLQERRVRPVGASPSQESTVDVRIIAATNRDLESDIAAGSFRHDLYYRVNVLHIHLPPLRDRREDIPELTNTLILKMRERGTWPQDLRLHREAIEHLCEHSWPGNVRELENVLERIAAAAGDASLVPASQVRKALTVTVRPLDFTPTAHPCAWREGESFDEFLDRQQAELFDHLLIQTKGNVAEVARRLKLKRTTLHWHIKQVRQRVAERTGAQPFTD